MIYQSTGAFPVSNIVELIEAGDYDFISAYELSSGPYIEDNSALVHSGHSCNYVCNLEINFYKWTSNYPLALSCNG